MLEQDADDRELSEMNSKETGFETTSVSFPAWRRRLHQETAYEFRYGQQDLNLSKLLA